MDLSSETAVGFQFPIAALAFVAITECVLRPAGNLTAASSDFIQQYSAIVARGRCSVYRKKDSLHYSERASKRARKSRRMRRNNGEDVKHELEAHHSPSARRMGMTAQRLNFPPESQVEQTAATCGKHGDCHGRPLPSGERTKTRRPGNQRDEDAIQVVHQVRPTLRYRRNCHRLEAVATARSLYQMSVNCYVFFDMDKSTIVEFYRTVLDQTISALLMTSG